MIDTKQKYKIEYGDFQTPIELANQICHKLVELGVNPEIIIEPTCGIGNFIDASFRTSGNPLCSRYESLWSSFGRGSSR